MIDGKGKIEGVDEVSGYIDKLKQQLKEAEEVIDFYADVDSWYDQEIYGCRSGITSCDEEEVEKHFCVGGKKARDYMTKRDHDGRL